MKKVYLYIAVAIFIVSSTEILLKLAGQSFDNGTQLNFLRFLIGGLFLLVPVNMGLKKRNRILKVKDYGIFLLLGFFFIVISMSLYQFAIEISTASFVAILFSFNPVFNTIFSCFILKERMTKRSILAVIVSTSGLLIIIFQYVGNAYVGIIFALLSAMIFGFYSTLLKRSSSKNRLDILTITCFSFLFGAMELAILMIASHINPISMFLKQNTYLNQFADIPFITGITLHNLPFLLYLSIVVTAGGFTLYFICLKEAGSSLASIIFFAKPAVALIFAALILQEKVSQCTMVGIIVITIGSYLAYRENRSLSIT